MAQYCYICNKQDGGVENIKINIFDTKTPISRCKIFEILKQISGVEVQEEIKKKNNLCAKCYKSLLEYDYLSGRLNEMKAGIKDNILKSEQARLTQTLKMEIKTEAEKTKGVKKNVKLVLPASKLQPLPPGFDLRMKTPTKWGNLKTATKKTVSKSLEHAESLPSQENSETLPSVKTEMDINEISNMPRVIIEPQTITTLLSKGTFSLNDLTKGFVNVLGKKHKDDEDSEEKAMEINEDAAVMEEGNGPILGLVSGQKFVYGDSEISLVLPDDDCLDNDDQDSNSESHIELQMSGDEETANAIIAAANEGAFIKVESGEMFQVKSIESKIEDNSSTNEIPIQMVELDGDKFKCLLCEKNDKPESSGTVLDDASCMTKHLKDVHGARLYICHCGIMLRRRADYAQHIEQHAEKSNKLYRSIDKSKTHECTLCQKKFSSRLLLTEHINKHTGTRPYTCDVCKKSFASRYTQQAHLKTHLERPRPFKCNECGKAFLTQNNLTHHEKIHFSTKDFVCNICGKAFGTQHNLEVHGVVHSGKKPFICPICEKGFARRAEVRDHMRIHTGERPFECDMCDARFSQRSNLHTHRRATHLDDKRHQCTQCPKKFKRRRLLDYHIKAAHTGERPLKCETCGATFVYPEHYKKHVRIHSGEKPFTCEVCNKGFNSRDNRNMHRFVHSDRKPYECVMCGAGYMRKHLLYQHMTNAGHMSASIVVNQPRVTKLLENEANLSQSELTTEEKKDKSNEVSVNDLTAILELDSSEEVVELGVAGNEGATKYIITTDKKLTLPEDNVESIDKLDGAVLENITEEQLEQAHILSDGNNTVRLIQIQLADGSSGWVAVSQ